MFTWASYTARPLCFLRAHISCYLIVPQKTTRLHAMFRITLEHIEELKARGFDAFTIALAEQQHKLWPAVEGLCQTIEEAFAGVLLGNGIGLQETQGLDNYESPEVCAAYRAKDEKEDWRRISAKLLSDCYSSLSFFDAEGMRFHLPAYLIADLRNEYHGGLVSTLVHSSNHRFSLLSSPQRLAVRNYLLLLAKTGDYYNEWEEILHAVDTYWTDPGTTPSVTN